MGLDLLTIIGAGIITLASGMFGNNGPSVKVQCIQSYGACITAGQTEEQCDIMLNTICRNKLKKENLDD